MNDNKDVELGRKLFRAMQEERINKERSAMSNKLARGFVILVIILGIISCTLISLGGPK